MKEKVITIWGVITLATVIIVTGCGLNGDNKDPGMIIDPVYPPETLELTRAELEMINHSNDFAFNLFRQIVSSRSSNESLKTKSIIVSPISITFALGMLNNGAGGDTQAQINKVLGFSDTGADGINAFCYKMLNRESVLDSLTKVMIANTIYMNKGYELKPAFLQIANRYYNAYPETRDFHDGKTMNVINQWASDNTDKMVQKVLDEDSFNPNSASYLLNAIYFKGVWTKKFDKESTREMDFYHSGSTHEKNKLPMMHMIEEFEYAESDGYQALRLPYGNGSFLMTAILPIAKKGESINMLPSVPSTDIWKHINEQMSTITVDLTFPRIETDTDINLKEIMSDLGMPDAFDGDRADFSNFCNEPVYIDLMKQVAKIKLDEEGTEAAAVTVIGMRKNSVGDSPDCVTFCANHPVLYVISEQNTGAILFIGQYTGN